jgi:hypothetical protein
MSTKSNLLEMQRSWALQAGLRIDDKGYLQKYESNLFHPLSKKALSAFENGSGSELKPTSPKRPAKMSALYSSSALAVNFFDYWSDTDSSPLLAALGIDGTSSGIRFEAQYPTGLPGTPPNLDVAIALNGGHVVAIESKFTEWLTPKSPTLSAFKSKYFELPDHWSSKGLHSCQRLAEAMQARTEKFRHLDAAQLLKHALGLANNLPKKFDLYYIYFDCPGHESLTHAKEIERFEGLVASDFHFKAISYREAFHALCVRAGMKDQEYLMYLRARYFPALAGV